MRKVKGYRYLPPLRGAIRREIGRQTVKEKQTKEAAKGNTNFVVRVKRSI
jgi:hypothetical protein